MTELRANSVPYPDGNEYYLGSLPGNLQYKLLKEELTTIPNIHLKDSDCGFIQITPTLEMEKRFIPDTTTGRSGDWQLLTVFQRSDESEIWMKAALLNKKDGCIALMTCTNNKQNIINRKNRSINSMEPGWYIGHYRMGAPMVFWRAVSAKVAELS
jgi:hypothetical protein